MLDPKTRRSATRVLLGAAILMALGASFGMRVLARTAEPPPARGAQERIATGSLAASSAPRAKVPEPRAGSLAQLPVPKCWSCSPNELHALEFSVDLDLLAPLGDGTGNAAGFFHMFTKGQPLAEEASKGRVTSTVLGRSAKIYPAAHPVLLDAEQWVDQSNCSFYPEYYALEGMETEIPNLLFTLTIGKSWIARGDGQEDRELAKQDYRRTIRLGRLMLQDDATLIQNLIGWTNIRYGAEALYREARREGDAVTMTAAALVLGDYNSIRQQVALRVTSVNDVWDALKQGGAPAGHEIREEQLEAVFRMLKEDPERVFRIEAMITLAGVRELGGVDQRQQAGELIQDLSRDDDSTIAATAQWFLDHPLSPEQIREMFSDGD
jgi:hypothetical protein